MFLLFLGKISVGNLLLSVSPVPAVEMYENHVKTLVYWEKNTSYQILTFLSQNLVTTTEQTVLHWRWTFWLITIVLFCICKNLGIQKYQETELMPFTHVPTSPALTKVQVKIFHINHSQVQGKLNIMRPKQAWSEWWYESYWPQKNYYRSRPTEIARMAHEKIHVA